VARGADAGNFLLVGIDEKVVVAETEELLEDPPMYARMAQAPNSYGDGRAAAWIAAAGHRRFSAAPPVTEWESP
jgi:UDP-N-acetylglucosamine 2-epimerase (non-hydrolysing)